MHYMQICINFEGLTGLNAKTYTCFKATLPSTILCFAEKYAMDMACKFSWIPRVRNPSDNHLFLQFYIQVEGGATNSEPVAL